MNENAIGILDATSTVEEFKKYFQMSKDAIEDLGYRYTKTKGKVKRIDYSKRLVSWLATFEGATTFLTTITGDESYYKEWETVIATLCERLES